MPRLESLAVGGYFPTPPEVVARIGAMIRPATHGGRVAVRLIDPCAGTGAALHQLAATIGGETFGVELEADRYEQAASVLDHALPGNALTARIEGAGFSCLFLNPPYDIDLDTRRLEHTFLTAMTKVLRPGGLLIYIVPRRRLATSARYLAGHYRDLACWRFPVGTARAIRASRRALDDAGRACVRRRVAGDVVCTRGGHDACTAIGIMGRPV